MDGRGDVDLGGHRLGGCGSAGRRDWQDVQEIIVGSQATCEVNG